jgi:hypothetical protein
VRRCDSRAAVAALEEAAASAQRAAPRSAELQPLVARAQERLPAAQAEVAAIEKDAQLEQLKDDNRKLRQQEAGYQCVVCMDAKKSVCLLPCKHTCMCPACAARVMATSALCPVCREPVADSFETFL